MSAYARCRLDASGIGPIIGNEDWAKAAETPDRGDVSALGGPSSVTGQLDEDRKAKGAISIWPDLVGSYLGFKKRVEEAYGFSFGFDYNALFQAATESLGEDTFGPGLDDQCTAEVYYRFQLLKVLSITPNVQLLFNPALNPDKDLIAIFGIRGRISL